MAGEENLTHRGPSSYEEFSPQSRFLGRCTGASPGRWAETGRERILRRLRRSVGRGQTGRVVLRRFDRGGRGQGVTLGSRFPDQVFLGAANKEAGDCARALDRGLPFARTQLALRPISLREGQPSPV